MRGWLRHSLTLVLAGLLLAAPTARADEEAYAPGEVVVRYQGEPSEREVELPQGVSVPEAVERLRGDPDVAYANPNYLASAAAFPDDPGSAGDWRNDQWNFLTGTAGGVGAPGAWQNLRDLGHAGARGVTVALLDTGVAYRNKGLRFRRDPDLPPTRHFVFPRDFVGGDRLPLDEDGHGTHVASTIAQATNNGRGLTGLAYGARLMPIRILNKNERGTGTDVARGIRFAAKHGADVINLSLEFKPMVKRCSQIVAVCKAVKRAENRGAVLVASAGNHARPRVAYPAAAPGVIGVGGTTLRGCVAGYSDYGKGLDLVAPGGGADLTPAPTGNPSCDANGPVLEISQFSLKPGPAAAGDYTRFGIVGLKGTSMSSAHVSGAAALMRAAGYASSQIESRLECTARLAGDPSYYGAGLLDAEFATSSRACP